MKSQILSEDDKQINFNKFQMKVGFVQFIIQQRLWRADQFFNAEQAVKEALKAWKEIEK